MFLAYIAFGIITGLIAAIVTLASGAGIAMSIAAYAVGGLTGMVFAVLWMLLPERVKSPKKTIPLQG